MDEKENQILAQALAKFMEKPEVKEVIDAHKEIGGTYNIFYKNIFVVVPKARIEDALGWLRQHKGETLSNIIKVVQTSVEQGYKRKFIDSIDHVAIRDISSGEGISNFILDLVLWQAIEILEGRASLTVQ